MTYNVGEYLRSTRPALWILLYNTGWQNDEGASRR